MTRLSVRAAAADAPDAIALADPGGAIAYRDLAAAVAARAAALSPEPAAVVAIPTRASAIEILARLEASAPTVLISPRTPPADIADLRARARALDRRAAVGLYTSGTTGRPRLVQLSRAALEASAVATWSALGCHPDDRWLLCLPLAHVAGLTILTRAVVARTAAILCPRAEPAALAASGATLVSLVPTQLERLLPAWPAMPRLRRILVGGASVPRGLIERARQLDLPVSVTYGMTETCSHVAIDGRAVPGVEIDASGDRIRVRGPMLMSGYAPPDDTTAAIDAAGWFTTADRARVTGDGCLVDIERALPAIVSGGEKIDPIAIERALEQIPGVSAAVAFGVPDPEWGQRVAVCVVAEQDRMAAIADAARERLGAFRPRLWVTVEQLPTTASGKVDRTEVERRSLIQFARDARP